MVLLTETQRSRLYENARNASSCTHRRNLSRKSRRKHFYNTALRYYRNSMNPVEDVWRRGRRLSREQQQQPTIQKNKEEDEEEAECSDYEDDDDEDPEEEDCDSESDSE
jgi:hypothetical protein